MSANTLNKLIGAVVVVFLLWGGVTLLSGHNAPGHPEGAIIGVFQDLTPASVKAVRMSRNGDTIALVRQGAGRDRWTVNGWTADSSTVAGMFSMLGDASVGDLVASNPANHERMGVSDDKAWKVTFDTDHGDRSLLVGDVGPRYGTTYVRVPGQDDVYLAEGDLRTRMAGRDVTEWRNKRVAHVDTASVRRIEVAGAKGSYALIRGDSAWSVEGAGKAGSSEVGSLLSQLSDLRADAFLTKGDSVASLPELASVTVLGASADTLAALRFGGGSGDHWARARGDSVTYKVPGWRVDQVAPPKSAVRAGS